MILSPRLTKCKDCNTIENLLSKIDRKIFYFSKKMYNNLVFMLNKHIDKQDFSDLLHYRRILTYRMYNEDYACNFCIDAILSRVRELTMGQLEDCICEENKIMQIFSTNVYYTSDGATLDPVNLIPKENTNSENIEILFNNVEGNYIYFVFLPSLGTLNRIYTETSPNNVISNWSYLPDITLNNETYKVMRPDYIMTEFTNFKHNFIFE